VSIIIPCHNDGKYLPDALASAQTQTCPGLEIIIVDDHSTEPFTCALLKGLTERGHVVLSVPDGKRGVAAARNHGIAAAKGAFILPLDADDCIEPAYAEKALERMQRSLSVGICYCKARLFGLKRGSWQLPQYTWENILAVNMIFATAMFRKKDWETLGGYDESLLSGFEDYAFWLRLIALGRAVVQIDEELFRYRVKPGSRTARIAQKKQEMQVIEDVFRSCEPIFAQNALLLFKHVHRLGQEKEALTSLVSWKLLRHILASERQVRQLAKKFFGRA
jgi:glycosyltransferase involved in cell wall biosynthesis